MSVIPVGTTSPSRWLPQAVITAFVLVGASHTVMLAQSAPALEAGYQQPPKVVMDIMDAPPPPTALISPTRQVIALLERTSLPGIADLAQPMLRLAGMRVNPRANGPYGAQTIYGITLKGVPGGGDTKVILPASAKISNAAFSRQSRHHRNGQRPQRLRLARRQLGAAVRVRTGRTRTGASPSDRARGTAYSGELRQGRSDGHVSGPADQRP
jgi:hypothetical protein